MDLAPFCHALIDLDFLGFAVQFQDGFAVPVEVLPNVDQLMGDGHGGLHPGRAVFHQYGIALFVPDGYAQHSAVALSGGNKALAQPPMELLRVDHLHPDRRRNFSAVEDLQVLHHGLVDGPEFFLGFDCRSATGNTAVPAVREDLILGSGQLYAAEVAAAAAVPQDILADPFGGVPARPGLLELAVAEAQGLQIIPGTLYVDLLRHLGTAVKQIAAQVVGLAGNGASAASLYLFRLKVKGVLLNRSRILLDGSRGIGVSIFGNFLGRNILVGNHFVGALLDGSIRNSGFRLGGVVSGRFLREGRGGFWLFCHRGIVGRWGFGTQTSRSGAHERRHGVFLGLAAEQLPEEVADLLEQPSEEALFRLRLFLGGRRSKVGGLLSGRGIHA